MAVPAFRRHRRIPSPRTQRWHDEANRLTAIEQQQGESPYLAWERIEYDWNLDNTIAQRDEWEYDPNGVQIYSATHVAAAPCGGRWLKPGRRASASRRGRFGAGALAFAAFNGRHGGRPLRKTAGGATAATEASPDGRESR